VCVCLRACVCVYGRGGGGAQRTRGSAFTWVWQCACRQALPPIVCRATHARAPHPRAHLGVVSSVRAQHAPQRLLPLLRSKPARAHAHTQPAAAAARRDTSAPATRCGACRHGAALRRAGRAWHAARHRRTQAHSLPHLRVEGKVRPRSLSMSAAASSDTCCAQQVRQRTAPMAGERRVRRCACRHTPRRAACAATGARWRCSCHVMS
jgi:hypothetical protein